MGTENRELVAYAQVDGIEVASWCPAPTPTVPATQVHVLVPIGKSGHIVLRFKSRPALDGFIAALVAHRDDVWPEGKR